MRVEKYYNFSPLKEAWKELYKDNNELSPYQSAEYAAVAFSHYFLYAVRLKVIPVFLAIIENNKIVMIVPLCKSVFKNEYTMFGDRSGYGYIDFIYSKNIAADTMEECLLLISQSLKGSKLRINRLRDDSILGWYLLGKYAPEAIEVCEHIDLPDSYDTYFISLKKSMRQNIRTAYNRLQVRHKAVALKMYREKPLTGELLCELTDLYILRVYRRYGMRNLILFKLFIKHFDIGTAAMKRLDNYVHFVLYIDDCPVAFSSGFISRDNNTITLIRLAMKDEFAEFSPGILLMNESIKKILELGLSGKIDLLAGDEVYKRDLGGKPHSCYSFELSF